MRARPRITWALGFLVVFLLLLFLVFLAINALSGFVRFVVAALLILITALALLMLLALLFIPAPDGEVPDADDEEAEDLLGAFAAARDGVWEKALAVLAEHREVLADLPSGDRRMELLLVWRQAIDTHAHGYADLVAGDERRSRVAELHGGGIMTAWSFGYMAGRGWITREEAELNVPTLGRALRDQVRDLGLPIDDLGLDLPLVVDRALKEIAELGLEDGGSEAGD